MTFIYNIDSTQREHNAANHRDVSSDCYQQFVSELQHIASHIAQRTHNIGKSLSLQICSYT